MASAVFHQAIGTLQSHQHLHSSGFNQDCGNVYVKLSSKCPKVDFGLSLSRKSVYSSAKRNFCVVQASASQTSAVDPVSTPSNGSTNEIKKKPSKPSLLKCSISTFYIQSLKQSFTSIVQPSLKGQYVQIGSLYPTMLIASSLHILQDLVSPE